MSDSDFEVVESVHTMQMEVDSLHQQLEDTGHALADEKIAHAATKAFLETLQASHGELKNVLAAKDRAYDETVAAKDSLVADLRGQIWQAGTQAASLRSQLQTETAKAIDETAAHATTKASLETLQSAHEAMNVELLATKASLTDSSDQLNTCRAQLQAKTAEASNEKAAHAATKSSLDASQATFSKYRAEMFEEATIKRTQDICNTMKDVEKNMTANGLFNLGVLLAGDETVTINGTPYTKKGCYLKALEIDPQNANAYNNLGNTLAGDETVSINGTDYTKKGCFLKALEIDPRYANSYHNLGITVAGDETVSINGTDYTKKGCYLKALEINPGFKNPWSGLGNMMTLASEPVAVNGIAYTKKECLAKGQ